MVDGAADRLRSAQHLLAGARQRLGDAAGAHHARDLHNVVHSDVAGVLDVLLLRLVIGCGGGWGRGERQQVGQPGAQLRAVLVSSGCCQSEGASCQAGKRWHLAAWLLHAPPVMSLLLPLLLLPPPVLPPPVLPLPLLLATCCPACRCAGDLSAAAGTRCNCLAASGAGCWLPSCTAALPTNCYCLQLAVPRLDAAAAARRLQRRRCRAARRAGRRVLSRPP